MSTRIGQIQIQLSARGIPSYHIELWHDGLRKHRHIKGPDQSIVIRKAQIQAADWDARWEVVRGREIDKEKRAKQRERHELLKQDAADQTADAKGLLESLESLLAHTLDIDDRIDWKQLEDRSAFPESKPSLGPLPAVPAPGESPRKPERSDAAFAPKFGFMDKLIPSWKRRCMDDARRRWESAMREWTRTVDRVQEADRLAKVAHEQQLRELEADHRTRSEAWNQRREEYLRNQQESNAAVQQRRASYEARDPEAIVEYCDMVLSASSYPDCLRMEWEIDFIPETGSLVVDYALPAPADIPTVKEVKYVQSRGEMAESHITTGQAAKLYDRVLYQIVLRTIHELFEADAVEALKMITFNGWVTSTDRSTGHETTACVLSLQAARDEFLAINLGSVDPKACFKALKGVGSSQLHSLAAVAPILTIRKEDGRFVSARELAHTLDDSVNIAAMDWEDFEHLVRELFESEFSSSGGEVKVTRASRDGGVDAIAYDPDPIRGGKIVIQAKRYTNTVGVGAVRDLYGTVVNEGATKGVLVTTADYGPDAYAFAKDKPLVLLNGANLLHLLQKHGHKARIDIKEAREQALRAPTT